MEKERGRGKDTERGITIITKERGRDTGRDTIITEKEREAKDTKELNSKEPKSKPEMDSRSEI